MPHCIWIQKTAFEDGKVPSTMWLLGLEFKFSGFTASTFSLLSHLADSTFTFCIISFLLFHLKDAYIFCRMHWWKRLILELKGVRFWNSMNFTQICNIKEDFLSDVVWTATCTIQIPVFSLAKYGWLQTQPSLWKLNSIKEQRCRKALLNERTVVV